MAHFAELDKNNVVIRVNYGPDHMDENEITSRTGIKTKNVVIILEVVFIMTLSQVNLQQIKVKLLD
jgi:hypothetical protein